MMLKSVRAPVALAFLAISLGACATSKVSPEPEALPAEARITLPPAPADVGPCLGAAFPAIEDRALTTADVVRIIGKAKLLDRQKSACGARALAWIEAVRADYATPAPAP